MHSCKGLQWRAVLILWADLLPYGRDPEQWKLERGLMYVAMTRAEDELVVTRSGIFAIHRRNRGRRSLVSENGSSRISVGQALKASRNF